MNKAMNGKINYQRPINNQNTKLDIYMSQNNRKFKTYPRSKKNRHDTPEVKILSTIGTGLWGLITLLFKPKPKTKTDSSLTATDIRSIRTEWAKIRQLVGLGSPSNYHKALIQADKLLDHSLKVIGYAGNTMADRLKSAKTVFTDYDSVWYAHKLRNRAVHDVGEDIPSFEVTKAIRIYETALRDLRIL
jgi:hypothetical protein